jgi:phosphoribulokinase
MNGFCRETFSNNGGSSPGHAHHFLHGRDKALPAVQQPGAVDFRKGIALHPLMQLEESRW